MPATQVEDERAEIPQLPTGSIDLQAPPDIVESQGMGNILATIIPMMGSMGVMIFMATQGNNPNSLLMGGGMLIAMLGMVGVNIWRQVGGHRKKVRETRREFLGYLAEMRQTARTAAERQRRHVMWSMPSPDSLVLIAAEGSRVWERDTDSEDVLKIRIGSTTQKLSMSLEEPTLPPLANPDPVCYSALHRFVAVHSNVGDLPFGVDLGGYSHIEVAGDPALTKAEVRAIVTHIATLAPPSIFQVAVLCSEDRRAEWEWLKWLPHARSQGVTDALGEARMIVSDYADLADVLGDEVASRNAFSTRGPLSPWPHVMVILDGLDLPSGTRLGSAEGTVGVTVVSMPTTWETLASPTTLRLIMHPGVGDDRPTLDVVILDQPPVSAVADILGIPQAEAIARRLTPWLGGEKPDEQEPVGRSDPKRSVDLMELLRIGDIRDFDADRQWVRRVGRDRLRVPFGVTPEGIPVALDIKESAQQGMGPHGLLIGATGSGKSEVLRTVVLALALTHSPEQLNFVLVDFKGGATFAGMSELPHVSAMISNLESELFLVDRMEEALRGEMVRRQELLRKAGNYANVTDYEDDRVAGKHSYEPLPALFIILDEFSELLSAKPDFIDTFVAIGRLGRSMSIHLLLSSQRLDQGRLHGLDSHLSYRIGLRTFSASESREVLGVPDAYELPSVPGVGYLKEGTETMTRFRASYVAAPPPARHASAAAAAEARESRAPVRIVPFTSTMQLAVGDLAPVAAKPAEPTAVAGDERWADMSEMDIAVAQMKGHGVPAHQVWLPPLEISDTFDQLMDDLAPQPGLGLVSQRWRSQGPLRVPLGTVDVPLEQRRETLIVDLSGAGGHMAIVGGPLTGKSMAARSLVMALSLTHTPREVQFYILDFGGGTFAAFDGGAHIAGIATRGESDVVQRMIAEIEALVDDREKYFRANRIDSIGTYREGRARGVFDDGYGDVFLVIDGWNTVHSDFDELEPRIQILAGRGLGFGVHIVLTTVRWMDLKQQLSDVIGSKFELRLGDPKDSAIDKKAADSVPEGRAGNGLEAGGHHALIALPRIDGDHNPETVGEGIQKTLAAIGGAWDGPPGPKLRLLPTRIALEDLQAIVPDSRKIILGVEESRLEPLFFDPATESHLFLFGDAKSGKSTFLRSLMHEIIRTNTGKQAKITAVDFRRSLLGEIPEDYRFGYYTTREEATQDMDALAQYLKTRLPGNDVTPEQLRNRSWWSGPEIWVLVDDYDLVATNSGNPIAQLQPMMAQAQDVGLHIIVARRSGGASRTMYEPVMQAMTELGATGIMLAGSPDEGQLIGRYKPMRSTPGRAQVISRDAGRIMAQLAWTAPAV